MLRVAPVRLPLAMDLLARIVGGVALVNGLWLFVILLRPDALGGSLFRFAKRFGIVGTARPGAFAVGLSIFLTVIGLFLLVKGTS
jgi:hypothetical protein